MKCHLVTVIHEEAQCLVPILATLEEVMAHSRSINVMSWIQARCNVNHESRNLVP